MEATSVPVPHPNASKRLGMLRPLFWLAAIAGFAAAGTFALVPPPKPSVRLADGSRVTVEAVCYGTEERVVGGPLQCLLHRVFPRVPPERLGVAVYSGYTNGLTYWVRRSGLSSSDRGVLASVFDELGNETDAGHSPEREYGADWYWFDQFSRRGRIAGLRFYRQLAPPGAPDRLEYLGEAPVVSPVPHSSIQWPAPALPSTNRSGDLTVSLLSLTPGTAAPTSALATPGELPGKTLWKAVLRLEQDGRLARGWILQELVVADATGNRWALDTWDGAAWSGRLELRFRLPALPTEEALKLRLRFVRGAAGRFRASETWRVRGVSLPGRGRTVRLTRKATVSEVPLELVGIYGPRVPYPGRGDRSNDSETILLVRSRRVGPTDPWCFPLEGRDERGRPVTLLSRGAEDLGG
jgi:hypothetical protein